MKSLLLASVAALAFAFAPPANATSIHTLTLNQPQAADDGLKDIFEVHSRRSPGSVILTDAVYGGICGLAIGGAVALIQDDGNWGRDLAVGAGVGLLVGGVFGAVDAASMSDRAMPHGFNSAVTPIAGKF